MNQNIEKPIVDVRLVDKEHKAARSKSRSKSKNRRTITKKDDDFLIDNNIITLNYIKNNNKIGFYRHGSLISESDKVLTTINDSKTGIKTNNILNVPEIENQYIKILDSEKIRK